MHPIRVMVVDDSLVARRLITAALSEDPAIEVVAAVGTGRMALAQLGQLAPDVITMDLEMPHMDGIDVVRAIRATTSRVPIIMFGSLTESGISATLDAFAAGADDCVTKPAGALGTELSVKAVRATLVPKIKALSGRRRQRGSAAGGPPVGVRMPPSPAAHPVARRTPQVVVVGASTGGPAALASLLQALPESLPLPVLVAQHMPPVFTRQFAERLDRLCALSVTEAVDGALLTPGTVHVAAGDRHLSVRAGGRGRYTALDQGPLVNYSRPSVDVLFRSAVSAYRGAVLGIVLTGMGSDGRDGAGLIHQSGGVVLVQDEATSVVWGMPGAVTEAGFAHEVLPLACIPEAIHRHLSGESRPATAATLRSSVAR